MYLDRTILTKVNTANYFLTLLPFPLNFAKYYIHKIFVQGLEEGVIISLGGRTKNDIVSSELRDATVQRAA